MPFFLRLFGAPGVDGPEGPLGGRIAQRHPLALLALLAAAPSATVSREKLLALLWPDNDTEHARGLLNVAVHTARKALGEGAVRSVGGSLQLDEEVVQSDLRAFAGALAAGEPERAVEAYAGPFLDGFFLDAEGFDAWAEAERARLAALYGEALERLAVAAEQAEDRVAAAGWWRRRAVVDPCDSRVALRLMQALAAAGDRAGAIQHARVHEALLEQSVGAAPPPELAAFAERLRNAPPPPAPADPPPPPMAPEPAPDPEALGALPAPTPTLPPSAPRRRSRHRLSRPVLLAAAAAGVLAGGAVAAVYRETRPRPVAPADGPVIAVLPFASRGHADDQAWLADELAAEIITALARIPGLPVVARTSAFAFRDSSLDVREIGRRLGARYVLEGSVGGAGDRLRVGALLVTVDGGYQVWSGSYEREPQELAWLQDEIAGEIVRVLRVGPGSEVEDRRRTRDPEAYDLYLQARHAAGRRTPEGLAEGMELLQQAVRRDPSFAQAYAGLAECHALLVTYGAQAPVEGYSLARTAAEQALALDRTLSEAHAALALVRLYHDLDFAGAGRSFTRAIRERPGYVTARRWYATFLAYQGRFDEALRELEQAQRLDPFSAHVHSSGSTILYYAGRYDQAIDRARAALVIDPRFWLAHVQVAAAYAQQGRHGEALAEIERAERLSGGHPLATAQRGYVLALSGRHDEARQVIRRLEEERSSHYHSPAYVAGIYTALGETDAALERLERAFEAHDDWAVFLPVEPSFAPLRSDPRFARLVQRIRANRGDRNRPG